MASVQQLTGMRWVYLVAAELSRLGFIASPTSRSAIGADILATNQLCTQAYAIQVKTNARTFGFWLLNKNSKEMVSKSHIYIFVNLRQSKEGEVIEYYIVPSKVVAEKMYIEEKTNSTWYSFALKDALPYQNKWELLGDPK